MQFPPKFQHISSQTLLNFRWKMKKPRIVTTILHNKGPARAISIPDFRRCFGATEMKTTWCCHKNRDVELWNQIEDSDTNSQTYEHLLFHKETKKIQCKK